MNLYIQTKYSLYSFNQNISYLNIKQTKYRKKENKILFCLFSQNMAYLKII